MNLEDLIYRKTQTAIFYTCIKKPNVFFDIAVNSNLNLMSKYSQKV